VGREPWVVNIPYQDCTLAEIILSKKMVVRSSDVGPDGLLRSFALMNVLQDIAGEHAGLLGFGVDDLAKKGMMWVACRCHVRIHHHLRWHQEATIKSWPSGEKGVMSLRDFEIVDDAGEKLVSASIAWLVIDLKRRRPLRPARAIGEIPVHPERSLETEFDEIETLAKVSYRRNFRPRFGEIDMNQHINNAVYLAWAMETVPKDFSLQYVPREIEIAFKAEILLGNEVKAETYLTRQDDRGITISSICEKKTKTEAARIRCTWEKIPEFCTNTKGIF